jgi:hypothetical protein
MPLVGIDVTLFFWKKDGQRLCGGWPEKVCATIATICPSKGKQLRIADILNY